MSFIIREGVKKDAQSILNLIVELAVFEKEPDAVAINLEILIADGFSENPKFKTFVAQELDGTIIGMALFYQRYSTWKGKSIHLEDLMVTQDKRGIGAGKKLYGSVMKYAQENDFKRVSWEVLDWNINAIEFYKNTGATVYEQWRVCQMDTESLTQFCNENI
ncbi:GNAT family N-acetyltransferase [Tenacibaculum piscium]|uniref:GNAT family acetyltransferase n=1 Tax=Tenacibaculum piscium TaxID=1458515 RepID=A0A2H1YJW0_9FLAO|nr:GNAT family N-acetyltransferase [Tenacibaculum piscium]MBE7629436.1 GNAT family N-acetyltransferase [Tenacibaculum piscium]MBE7671307.1 GNAT family N-acetyltransferase [Tenacibaculum piscium]MBE7686200.1 GNAT family N-acetyltransferase [Tenacibaculum piscium]MBE7689936.1 GNAT family N-acetyltransferase [Tenacibaculum piscium]MCG8183112.1 GNAT family N-acetyltransferase [Tenacibaculum piscium]